MSNFLFKPLAYNQIKLSDSRLTSKRKDNYKYLMQLTSDNLIRNFEYEAGLMQLAQQSDHVHGGWETPYCQVRGHFFGHWLSGAAQHYAATGDREIKAKADALVDRLGACQAENGGQWAGSIPEKYLHWIAAGKSVWAPQYTLHKTFMGLLDMYHYADNDEALAIAEKWASWFDNWSASFSRDAFDDILDFETGGMLEIWARMLAYTGKDIYRRLVERYDRKRLFEPLLAGIDVLTNMHANTTIPEIMGAAAVYQATGEQRWLDICLAYWQLAVVKRGQFCTGGQTLGEIWTPPHQQQARLGDKNQEHCTVFNMMRLADFLFSVTGDVTYADYYEQNLYNGIFAQAYWHDKRSHGATTDYPKFGLLTYFLPLRAGGRKGWAHETQDFYCCHGTLVQANATFHDGLVYTADDAITLTQYFSFASTCELPAGLVSFHVEIDTLSGQKNTNSVQADLQNYTPVTADIARHPHAIAFDIQIDKAPEAAFTLRVRIPWWIQGKPEFKLNGKTISLNEINSFASLNRIWQTGDTLHVTLPRGLHCWPMPDAPDYVAFMDGPVVLAGLVDEERVLCGDINSPETLLRGDNEREWAIWQDSYYTKNLDQGFRFIPFYEVGYEPYTIYFPVKPDKT